MNAFTTVVLDVLSTNPDGDQMRLEPRRESQMIPATKLDKQKLQRLKPSKDKRQYKI
jgi:hypothetical protein